MHEALFYEKLADQKVKCTLCPWNCVIGEVKVGVCSVRQNVGGMLYSLIYAKVASIAVDPIEKKPLYRFHPGTEVLSVGSYGCNMKCGHCQNWQIAHVNYFTSKPRSEDISPERLIAIAKETGSSGIAWTYNEPSIWFEYALAGAKLAKKSGLYTVFVTNGYISIPALDEIAPYLDAYSLDIKAFNNETYQKLCQIKDFQPILDASERAKKKWNMHVEVVTNIIPGLNDEEDQLKGIANWIAEKLGADTPWHVTRFFPFLKYKHLPPTPIETLEQAKKIGKQSGLRHVFIGNV